MLRVCRLAAVAWLLGAVGLAAPAGAESKTVALTSIIAHPALDAVRRGILDELAAAGYASGDDLEIVFESAEGSRALAERIATRFAALEPDVIVPISTPSAQTVAAATSEIPVVFAGVTDPLGAKLVASLEHPGGNVTGMSDLSPVGEHLDLIKEVLPGARRLGVVTNPNEANSRTLVRLIRGAAPKRDLEIVAAEATSGAEVGAAAEGLVGAVDAVYVPTDNTVVAELDAVVRIGRAAGIPVFAGDVNAVPRGAVAALGFNYYDLGRQAGRLVVRVLEGEAPGRIPVQSVRTSDLVINPAAAEAMGVRFSSELVERAKTVVPSGWSVPRAAAGEAPASPTAAE